jgi:predicted esterase
LGAAVIAFALAARPVLALDPAPASEVEPDGGALSGTPAAGPAPFVPGIPTWVPVPGDKAALVIHGPSTSSLAIVYLHGLCGNVRAIESFSAASARHGTVIALLGDRSCPGGRFKWGKKVDAIAARVDQALAAVKRARAGLLDDEHPVLFGYSQGAAKVEQLVAHYPNKYRLVVLGGPPRVPRLPHLGGTTAVAVLGGERETTGHMRAGAQVLAAAGKPVRFFLLPAAKHGEFGPEGNRVVDELLSWLLATGGG